MTKRKLTKHHIIPKCRGGSQLEDNISHIPKKTHDLYHHLFADRTPVEIIDYLVTDFWNGKDDAIVGYIELKYVEPLLSGQIQAERRG